MSIRHLLRETLTQERVTGRTSDGRGGFTAAWTTVSSSFRGRISSGAAQERERGGRREAYYRHTLFAGSGADVRRGDRFTRADGTQFAVEAVRQLSLGHHVEAIVEEQRSAT